MIVFEASPILFAIKTIFFVSLTIVAASKKTIFTVMKTTGNAIKTMVRVGTTNTIIKIGRYCWKLCVFNSRISVSDHGLCLEYEDRGFVSETPSP
jgi:hypothetical protein